MKKVTDYFLQRKLFLAFILLLAFHIFFRFYLLIDRANLGWDQADSAFAARSILVDHHYFLNGVPVKNNSGIFMGPLYYYLITPVYLITRLDPIASPIFAAFISIVSCLIVYLVTKKLAGEKIALIAMFINTFSFSVMDTDRIQSAYALIVPISYVIFYFLYKILSGDEKSILWLAVATGISFHIDFTSIFYPIIILFMLPFFPKTKKTIIYILISLPIFIFIAFPFISFLIPPAFQKTNTSTQYFQTFYHGLHFQRVLQLAHDGFISLEAILQYPFLRSFVFIFPPIFISIYYFHKPRKDWLIMSALIILWILVPWLILSTYSGEITAYYFSASKNVFIFLLAYLLYYLFSRKFLILKLSVVCILIIYAVQNSIQFFQIQNGNLIKLEQSVRNIIKANDIVPFNDKDPKSYLYIIYSNK